MYKYNFYSNDNLLELIDKNKDKYIIKIEYLKTGNFITFSDIPSIDIILEEQGNKISILEGENENLKQELALTQDAVNEILFMMMNMEVK